MEKDTPANNWQPQSADDADSPDFSGFPSACIGAIGGGMKKHSTPRRQDAKKGRRSWRVPAFPLAALRLCVFALADQG